MGFTNLALDTLIARNHPLQIVLRGNEAQGPIGPGMVSPAFTEEELAAVTERGAAAGEGQFRRGELRAFYKISAAATLESNGRPMRIEIPIVFHVGDVAAVFGPPVNPLGETAIVTPGGGRTPSGLHIPGSGS